MPEIAARLGPVGALAWFAKNMPRYERMLKELGPLTGHLLCIRASLYLGCPYCIYGHARAFELHYFKKNDRLFPIDAHHFLDLRLLDDAKIEARLKSVLTEAGMEAELPRLQRMWQLKYEGATPAGGDDAHLNQVVQMFEVLNFCAMDSATPLDDAHDPIQKDTMLKERYALARLRSAAPATS
jgi:hypothetical protein